MISNSFDIVQYLDKQYPSSPRVITPGTLAFEAAYYKYIHAGVRLKWPNAIYHRLYEISSPESAVFLKGLKEQTFGDTLENVAKNPQPQWDAYKDALSNVILPIYENAEGVFLKGSEPSWADFVTASWVLAIKLIYGGDSKEWKYIETWDGGRWVKLIKDLEPYAYVG